MRQLRSNQASQKDEPVDRLYQRYVPGSTTPPDNRIIIRAV